MNLPMLIELIVMRGAYATAEDTAEAAVTVGQAGVTHKKLEPMGDDEETRCKQHLLRHGRRLRMSWATAPKVSGDARRGAPARCRSLASWCAGAKHARLRLKEAIPWR